MLRRPQRSTLSSSSAASDVYKRQGRDRICKIIQYLAQLLKWWYSTSDKAQVQRFQTIQESFLHSRKLFRLFKSIQQIPKLQSFILDKNMDKFQQMLDILTHSNYFFHFIFDNIAILSVVKVLNYQPAKFSQIAQKFWLLGIITTIISIIYQLKQLSKDFNAISKDQKLIHQSKVNALLRRLITMCCDSLVALNGSQAYEAIFGSKIHQAVLGVSGIISGAIAAYDFY
eukprot:TRINITY_DN5767_c0_g1_i2.p1 TRINITY_DN5767_c0_g1~~TRINITY_DN5767_c0_g1_i2.p1  ORF type:complete len:228 (-),score=14.58 TRINITY_DN5767_c0_g1_i2:201-884(-)